MPYDRIIMLYLPLEFVGKQRIVERLADTSGKRKERVQYKLYEHK